jgi:hypothetical protein
VSEATSTSAEDRTLSRLIAGLMRWGTLTSTTLLVGGAIFAWAGRATASTALVASGCGALILLPILRLLLMLIAFARRADKVYVAITVVVVTLILATAMTGLLL